MSALAPVKRNSNFILTLLGIPVILFIFVFHSNFHQRTYIMLSPKPLPNVTTVKASESLPLPPVIVQPVGGLGNQLFQYAAAYSLAKRRQTELYLCLPRTSWNNSLSEKSLLSFSASDRSYSLNVFNVPHTNLLLTDRDRCVLTDYEIFNKTSKPEIYYPNEDDLIIDKLSKNKIFYIYYVYMESELFFRQFKNEVSNLFTIRTDLEHHESFYEEINKISSHINDTESVAVHVRRGDFANPGDYRILPVSYYNESMQLMKENIQKKYNNRQVTFFVFSDDIESVKRDFKNLTQFYDNIVFVSNRNLSRICDFLLMSLCKHNIVANSTFSWWAAYLNRNEEKLVIAPLPKFRPEWYSQLQGREKFLKEIYGGVWSYPYDWTTINPHRNSTVK